MIRSALGHILILVLFLASCAKNENVIPKPSISISNESITDWKGCLSGHALGVDPDLYYISIFIKVEDLWYVFPGPDSPFIPISEDNQWNGQLESFPYSEVNEIVIFLLPNTFNSPVLDGERSIPMKLKLVAAATYRCSLENKIL